MRPTAYGIHAAAVRFTNEPLCMMRFAIGIHAEDDLDPIVNGTMIDLEGANRLIERDPTYDRSVPYSS